MKNQISQGFTLIELVVALVIASGLMLALYQTYKQVQNATISLNTIIDIDTPLQTLYDRLSIDIPGIIVPSTYLAEVEALLKKEDKNEDQKKQEGADKKEAPKKEAEKKEESQKLEDVFSYQSSDNSFKLTFITTGGIKSIDTSSPEAKPLTRPSLKRVYYTLEPDKSSPELYRLTWGQTENLQLKLADGAKLLQYELAWDIKKMSMSFFVYEAPKAESKSKPTPVELKNFNPKEVFEKYKTYVPAYVVVTGILVDQRRLRELPFTFELSVPSYAMPIRSKDEKEETEEKKEEADKNKKTPVPPSQPKAPAKPPTKIATRNNQVKNQKMIIRL